MTAPCRPDTQAEEPTPPRPVVEQAPQPGRVGRWHPEIVELVARWMVEDLLAAQDRAR